MRAGKADYEGERKGRMEGIACGHSSPRYRNDDTTDEFDVGDSAFLYWAWAASVVGFGLHIKW